jgi:hypothetical protein
VTRPSSSPRGERPGTVPATWEQHLVRNEHVIDDTDMNQPLPPRPNRATRRALARAARKKNR